jgi:hypothetical protein
MPPSWQKPDGAGMWEQLFIYCERGPDPGFWAEPLNAITNIAFLIAAVMAYTDLRAGRAGRGEAGEGAVLLLIGLLMVIGAGSFLFHTLATRWAALADTIPIGLFTFAYLVLALRRFLGLGAILSVGLGLLVTVASQVMPPWFNGSFGYAPALLSMLLVGLLLKARDHAAGSRILAAAGIFALSLTFRTLDGGAGCFSAPEADPQFLIGTHPLWHILNAVVLYQLLRAAIENPPQPDHKWG